MVIWCGSVEIARDFVCGEVQRSWGGEERECGGREEEREEGRERRERREWEESGEGGEGFELN